MKTEKKILKRDQASIDFVMQNYQDTKKRMQEIIDGLAAAFEPFIPLNDQHIIDLITEKPRFDQWLTDAINKESEGFKFEWQKRETKAELDKLRQPAAAAHAEINSLFRLSRELVITSKGGLFSKLDFRNFTIKDLKVSLKPGLKDEVTNLFTLYLEGEIRIKAYELSVSIAEKTKELAALIGTPELRAIQKPGTMIAGQVFPGHPGLLQEENGVLKINESFFSRI